MILGINLKIIIYIFYITIVCLLFFSCDRQIKKADISGQSNQIRTTDSGYVDRNYLELIDSSRIAISPIT